MSFDRARYVSCCQQLLVTVSVLMLGVTAAGALTLDIAAPEATTAPAPASRMSPVSPRAPHTGTDRAEVATAPVRPKVAQVRLAAPARPSPSATPRAMARPSMSRIAGLPVVLTSPAQTVHGYATVGAVWAHGVRYAEDQIAFQVRTSTAGAWSAWQRLEYHEDHAADGTESTRARERPGTDPCLIGHVDQVQLRVATANGTVPPGLELSLVDPGSTHLSESAAAIDTSRVPATDTAPDTVSLNGASTDDTVELSSMKAAPKPQIFSRAQWGADERIRERGLPDYGTIKTGFVHHTVNANDYSRSQVPAIIRSIYAYHVLSRGWRDIGYNFLVDRFGRIWEGRYGGVDKPVIGAHTLGFNDVGFAMSAIGNFDVARPPQAVIDAFARLFAWKLSMYGISATATGLRIHGRILRAINGHRDVGQTACPGRYLYARIPDIRTEAKRIQSAAQAYSPTQRPGKAIVQPGSVRAGGVRELLQRTGAADIAMQSGNGHLATLPLGRMVGFRPAVRSAASRPGSWSGAVPVGDVTGDHRGDVLTRARHTAGWMLHKGTRKGSVATAATDKPAMLREAVKLVPVGDWNGDHRPDVLGITKKNTLVLFRGKGAGRFGNGVRIAWHWKYTRTVSGGDLDRDGHPELLVQTATGHRYRIPSLAPKRLGPRTPLAVSNRFAKYFGGTDMTGDGVADVWARTGGTKRAYILPGNGHGGFGTALGPFGGFGSMSLRGVVDMTAGGRADIVGRGRHGKLIVRANNQRKNSGAVIVSTRKISGVADQVLAVGDWNRDGIGDVIVRRASRNRLVLLRGTGGGQFARGITMSNGWATISKLAAVGDITGDRRPDLVGRNAHGTALVFPGNGTTGFARPHLLPASVRTFNVVGGPSWSPHSFGSSTLASSDGSFVPLGGASGARTIDSATSMRHDWVIGPGDVNADGHPDLLVRGTGGKLWLIPGTATGVGHRIFVRGGLGSYRLGG